MIRALKINKFIRVLAIARNPGLNPVDRMTLLTNIRRAVKFRVINARIASDHVELDVDVSGLSDIDELRRLGFEVMEVINIEDEARVDNELDVRSSITKYVELFNRERFWEAHEVLEKIWRRNRDEGIRGLIILAAAFVKTQENNPGAFRRLMATAKELIMNNEIPWINKESILRKIDYALATMRPFKIDESDIKRA